MENQLFEKNNRPAISACFIYLILGLLCCISLVLTLVNLLNGEQVKFNVGQLIGGIFGLSMIYKGINGFQANQADNPLASSIIWFTWIAIGLPVAFTLFQLLLIFVDFGDYWVALFSLPMVILGIKAISSIFQHLPDALYLAKSFVLLFAAGVFVVIVSYFATPTTLLLYSSAFRIILAAGALIYIFKSSAFNQTFQSREKTKFDKILVIISIVLIVVVFMLSIVGILLGSSVE